MCVRSPLRGMEKRQLGWSLVLGGVAFVAFAHAAIALLAFDTGLEQLSGLIGIVALVGLALVNL